MLQIVTMWIAIGVYTWSELCGRKKSLITYVLFWLLIWFVKGMKSEYRETDCDNYPGITLGYIAIYIIFLCYIFKG